MLHALLLLVAFTDLAPSPPRARPIKFAEPEWVVADSGGFLGGTRLHFALYRDGNAVYRDDAGNLAHVRLDAAARRELFRGLPLGELAQLPRHTDAGQGCDDCATWWVIHWSGRGSQEVGVYADGYRSLPPPFRAVFERLDKFRSPKATILEPARIFVAFAWKWPLPADPLPPGWPAALPVPRQSGGQFTVTLDQTQLPAMRAFAAQLDPKRWGWSESPITPSAPHEEMWARPDSL